MQGAYAWLDANYLDNRFVKNQPPLGILQIGNISNEIAFATRDKSKSQDEITINIHNQIYTVFSKSFSQLGFDQARESMNTMPQASFCYPLGYPLRTDIKGNFNLETCMLKYDNVIRQSTMSAIQSEQNQLVVAFTGADETGDIFGVEVPEQMAVEARRY